MARLESLILLACLLGADSVSLRGPGAAHKAYTDVPRGLLEEEDCLKAIDKYQGVPVVLYLSRRGPSFFQLSSSGFVLELIQDINPAIHCESTRDGREFAPEVLKRTPSSRVAFLFDALWVSFESLYEIVARSPKKPDMLIQVGDRNGHMWPETWYPRILPKSGLVVRQYHHIDYVYRPRPRVVTMPVGFDKKLPLTADSCAVLNASTMRRNATARQYLWSYMTGPQAAYSGEVNMRKQIWVNYSASETTEFGQQLVALNRGVAGKLQDKESALKSPSAKQIERMEKKSKRLLHEALAPEKFKDKLDDEHLAELNRVFNKQKYFWGTSHKMKAKEGFQAMQDSTFALMPALEVENLETTGLYAAILAGAIPVIVGLPAQYKYTFWHHRRPPFVFANSWEEAKKKMLSYAQGGRGYANLKQANISAWYCNFVGSLRQEISSFMQGDMEQSV